MLVVGDRLLVIGRQIGVGDFDGIIGYAIARGEYVFHPHLLVGFLKTAARLARANLHHTHQGPLQLVAKQLLSEHAFYLHYESEIIGIAQVGLIAYELGVFAHIKLPLGLEGLNGLDRRRGVVSRRERQLLIRNLDS